MDFIQGKMKQMKLNVGKAVVTSKDGNNKEPPKKIVRLVHEEDEMEESELGYLLNKSEFQRL